ncbi:MAG: carbohydrate binding domain-containing protein [Patescibacteria group bacterium]
MALPRFSDLSRASKLSLFGVLVLTLGVFVAVQGALQQQDTRQRATVTNLVQNPSFESGIGGWQFNKRAGDGSFSTTTSSPSDGATAGQIAITASTGNASDIELAQYGLPITSGQTYTVVFFAKASANRTINTVIQQSSSPFTVYKNQTFSLTTNWQQFTYNFVAPSTQSNVFIGFQMANATGTVWLDNVQFYQGSPVALPAAPTGLTVTPGNTTANLTWNAVSGATGYYIYYRDVTANPAAAFSKWENPVTGTTAISQWMTNGHKYEFKLTAFNASGEGPASAVVSVTPVGVTPTNTSTPTPTKTPTPSPTKTPTPTPSPTNQPPTATLMPSATSVPNATQLGLVLRLHGIGKGGDSQAPNSTGNMNPLHPQRTVAIEIYNAQNQLVLTKQGTVTFDTTTGKFAGNVALGTGLGNGVYTVRIKPEQFISAIVPGIQTITVGQVNQLPETTFITGDINDDNQINILDYNILMGCYSDFEPAKSCTVEDKVRADLDDNGEVNLDLNLFLRELTTRGGQ